MLYRLLTLFVFLNLTAIAQDTAFQVHEVDSAATPRGGIPYFNTFLQSNLRKPLSAEAKGIGGTVILNGIVEADGRLSNVTVSRSFQPNFDKEALRVFSRFNAWKPAQKAGKAVRQQVTIPITFKPNTPFQYVNGARISYFNKDGKAMLDDSSSAQFKQITPLDTSGIPSGDVVIYEAKGKKWKEYHRLTFVNKAHSAAHAPCKSCRTVGLQNAQKEWQGDVYMLDANGNRIRQTEYDAGKPTGTERIYHQNGLLSEKTVAINERLNVTKWYANGQIKQIKTFDKPKPLSPSTPEQVAAVWDSTGQQSVLDGNGNATYQEQVISNKDTTKHTLFIEKGTYANGLKQGVWRGNYADNSYYYEETYDKGLMQNGKSKRGQSDTLQYTVTFQSPEFPGGLPGLGKFLSQNLSYPVSAQKMGVQGKVFVSFVVCTDGTLCDYEVVQSVQPDLDKEALRVVKEMSGKWKPGVQRGQKVRVKYNLPINFSLN
ncbi:hypothetical protein GCM10028807_36740 [Spirosoma daeguense]